MPKQRNESSAARTPLWWRAYRSLMRLRHGPHWPTCTKVIPDEDVARAALLAKTRGWADVDA